MPSSLTVPTIDLKRDDNEILPTLERALCDIGFVLVKGHGVPAELVSALRQRLVDYFDRPLPKRWLSASRPITTGATSRWAFSPNTEGVTPDQYEGYKLAKSRPRIHCAAPVTFMAPTSGQASRPDCRRPPRLFGRPARPPANGYST